MTITEDQALEFVQYAFRNGSFNNGDYVVVYRDGEKPDWRYSRDEESAVELAGHQRGHVFRVQFQFVPIRGGDDE